ncbi:hypothetical protein L5515_006046 [Caenorhabditis briggsae]|uniref:T20D4.11-like domain-containing protein n=1 Tax=Caenorhabditis briggsae TaxID=6238 RepID=A0AAE9JJH9_CAEBR|nr:hypothetical protein L5515_006046 [Caenorhabditis briggsae]
MFILFILLVTFVSGIVQEKCTPLSGTNAYRCIKNLNEIDELTRTVNIYNEDERSQVNEPCLEFKKCYEKLKCDMDDDILKTITNMVAFCDVIEFHQSNEFAECDDKIGEKNSTCISDWAPFPPAVPDDEEKTKKVYQKACENFFGADRCVEKEVTENCGSEMWNLFQKHYLALNNLFESCDLDEMGNIRT